MFNKERFIEECRAALKESHAQRAAQELVAKAVRNPAQIFRELGEPKVSGLQTVYRADDLTILNLCWGPQMRLRPHNHLMWAVIGIYTGREQNFFFRRSEQGLKRHGAKELNAKDVVPLGDSIIHSVTNPLDEITGAIHVYGGDFFAAPRSEWDPATLREEPFNIEHTREAFEEANDRLRDK
jgi:predicted metal-dependent enzyme (double-stranded beta helix superfamily)